MIYPALIATRISTPGRSLIVPAGTVVRSGLYRSEDGKSIRSVIFQLCGGCLCCHSSSHSTCGEVHAIFSVFNVNYLRLIDYHRDVQCTSLLCAPSLPALLVLNDMMRCFNLPYSDRLVVAKQCCTCIPSLVVSEKNHPAVAQLLATHSGHAL